MNIIHLLWVYLQVLEVRFCIFNTLLLQKLNKTCIFVEVEFPRMQICGRNEAGDRMQHLTGGYFNSDIETLIQVCKQRNDMLMILITTRQIGERLTKERSGNRMLSA